MPKGQGQRRSADAVGGAVQAAKIATGEESEAVEKPRPTFAAILREGRVVFQAGQKIIL